MSFSCKKTFRCRVEPANAHSVPAPAISGGLATRCAVGAT